MKQFVHGMLLATLLGVPATWQTAWACACCADRGQRTVQNEKLDAFRLDEIRRLRFEATAHLYLTDAGFDPIRGISAPSDSYHLQVARSSDRYVFNFRDKTGRTGSLALSIPKTIAIFEVDLHEDASPGNLRLYKEWKLWSRPGGTGIFSDGIDSNQNLTLILHGRGNRCPNAEDFTGWTLVMQGPRAAYSLYGKLRADR